jgi:hypothetical protein
LEQDSEDRPDLVQFFATHRGNITIFHQYRAGISLQQPQDQLQGHTLALAAATGNDRSPAAADLKINMIENGLPPETLYDVNQFDYRFTHRRIAVRI